MKLGTTIRTPFILLCILVTLVFISFGFFVVYVNRMGVGLGTLEQELAQQTAREKQADNLGRFVADIANEEQHIRSFFVDRNNVITAITTIESLSNDIGVPVSIVQVDVAGQTQDTPGVLTLRISATGSWQAVSKLLALLEHLPFQAEVEQVAMSTGSGQKGTVPPWTLQAVIASQLIQ